MELHSNLNLIQKVIKAHDIWRIIGGSILVVCELGLQPWVGGVRAEEANRRAN